jgi:hypothetical protein
MDPDDMEHAHHDFLAEMLGGSAVVVGHVKQLCGL